MIEAKEVKIVVDIRRDCRQRYTIQVYRYGRDVDKS